MLLCLAAGVWRFLADEALEPATKAWLDTPRADQDAEGLDSLFFMGLMAPLGADPTDHARDLMRQLEEDFNLRVDYVLELMADSPCEIDDWGCWENDDTSWVAEALADYAHVLERWYSLPVHHDFGTDSLTRWLFALLGPSLELLSHLMTLQLLDGKRNQRLDELATLALDHAVQLSVARPTDGNSIALVMFEVLKRESINQMMRAVRFGGEPPDQERLDQFMVQKLPVGDQLVAWGRSEFDRLQYAWPRVYRDFLERRLDNKCRTLNRARACLEQVIELADPAPLFEFMEAEAKICGDDWRSWRNWHGDRLIDLYIFSRNDMACRIRELAHGDDLVIALLDALVAEEDEANRLAAVARANPFYPERGAFLKADRICFEPLAPACGQTCLQAPWPVTSSLE